MRSLLIAVFVIAAHGARAQGQEGIVTYERTQFWTKILPKLTFLSKEQLDRELRTWGSNDEGWKTKYQLVFTENENKYSEIAQESEYGYNDRLSDYLIYRNFATNKRMELEDVSGKSYLVDDSLSAPTWKVMNKIKEINGQLCMMAVTEDTVRSQKIVAWFANNLSVPAGPERYFGLPGLIMELDIDDGAVIITAVKVDIKPVGEAIQLPKKMKGKKITGKEYDKLVKTTLDTAIKGRRYPYSAVRF
ncbi:MAG TPA: GLPGLI family protein [Dyadobacter sp.]|nr:GLPGLI family protein [Dyadobacter sp.]